MTAPVDARVAWRYTFFDLVTREPLARLPLVDADLSEVIRGPAAGSGKVPVVDPDVRAADPWTATTPRRTLCLAQRVVSVDERTIAEPVLWGGIVWKRVRSGRHLTLTMATAESYWRQRQVARNQYMINMPPTFPIPDDAAAQRLVIAHAEAVVDGSIGVTYDAPLLALGVDTTRQQISPKYRKKLLDVVDGFAATGGFEWRLVPGIAADGRYTMRLQQAVRLGRTDPSERTWVSAPEGRPGNELIGYELVEDGTAIPNRLLGLGPGSGDDQLVSVLQPGDEPGYPLLESTVSIKQSGGVVTQAALDAVTVDALANLRNDERQLSSVTVRGDRGATVDTYGLGDAVGLVLNDDLHPTPSTHVGRILGRRIVPAQPGRSEVVAMSLGPVS